QLLGTFPPQLGILQGGEKTPRSDHAVEDVIRTVHDTERRVVADLVVPRGAGGDAELRIVDEVDVLHEALFRDGPGERRRGEGAPAVVGAEARGAVRAYRRGEGVAVEQAVVRTAEHG